MQTFQDRPKQEGSQASGTGFLMVNADDWGRDRETTDRIWECAEQGTISSVSAMVFMQDSQRAAEIALEKGIVAGLHLNFTTGFSASGCPPKLLDEQVKLTHYLRRHRLAQVVFHPGLARAFEYVVRAQLDEFRRLYAADPKKLDGHHHMHLCENVLWQGLLPPGTLVRRNFSFRPGEKSAWNRLYRRFIDSRLARRHRLVDFFFSLEPLEPRERLSRIFFLAHSVTVEVVTHPIRPDEYEFLARGGILRELGEARIASLPMLRQRLGQ